MVELSAAGWLSVKALFSPEVVRAMAALARTGAREKLKIRKPENLKIRKPENVKS